MQAAGRIENDDVDCRTCGPPRPFWQTAGGIGRRGFAVNQHAQLLADDFELVDGSRALHVGGDNRPPLGSCNMRASLPQVVVLPLPCRPQSISTTTSPRAGAASGRPAHQVDQLWWTMPTNCS